MGTTLITCTVCGAQQPLVAAYKTTEARDAWEAALGFLPTRLAELLIRYVDMFARPGKAPQERTVARVLSDLRKRMSTGQITKHNITYGAPVDSWEMVSTSRTGN